METEFLKSLVLIFGVSGAIVFVLGRLGVPSIVGFLLAGVVMGPYGFRLIGDIHVVELMAEIGVILLMFTIGLEFSLRKLLMLRTVVIGGGLLQVLGTIIVVMALGYVFFVEEPTTLLFDGFLVSLSSTAIVIKLLMDKGEINAPHGRTSVGILIFQDLCVVPFMLLVPILAGRGGGLTEISLTIIKAVLVVVFVLAAARWGVPQLLHQVVRTRSRELFIITIILMCAGTALLTWEFGLSLALGAFLAGIVISESEYASQAVSDILPFKESFTGLFFISVGMLMDLGFLMSNILIVAEVVILIVLVKMIIATLASLAIGESLRSSLQSGFYLAQIGEFSFVLAVAGRQYGLIGGDMYQAFLAASILTMILTPFLVNASPKASTWIVSRRHLKRFDRSQRGGDREGYSKKSDHVIIVGYGVNGRNLARVLRESDISYVILELNSVTVRKMKKKGEPIYYGDGTSAEILHKLGIQRAKMAVIAISDAAATRRITQIARKENPRIHLLVRTRYVAEIDDLKKLGADEVIPEEFETSMEIFSRVLHYYNVPRNTIREYIDKVREDSYRMLRSVSLPMRTLSDRQEFLKDLETETVEISGTSKVDGFSLKELRLRSETGATIIAIQRGERVHHNPPPNFLLRHGDVVLLIGSRTQIGKATDLLS